jgi:type III secretion protein J
MALAVLLLLCACKTELNRGLSENDANDEVAILLRAGIPASREAAAKGDTMTVSVEKGRFADAVAVLHEHGYPKPRFASIGSVFAGSGLVSSPMDERARMIYALGQELSHTISDIDGVLTARVQIVLPENDPLRLDTTPSSASVFIRYDPATPIEALVGQIKMLVANGVAGLTYDKVSVVTVPAVLPADRGAAAGDGLVSVAGLWVDRGSAWILQAILGIGLTLILVLGGATGWLAWRQGLIPALRRGATVR